MLSESRKHRPSQTHALHHHSAAPYLRLTRPRKDLGSEAVESEGCSSFMCSLISDSWGDRPTEKSPEQRTEGCDHYPRCQYRAEPKPKSTSSGKPGRGLWTLPFSLDTCPRPPQAGQGNTLYTWKEGQVKQSGRWLESRQWGSLMGS